MRGTILFTLVLLASSAAVLGQTNTRGARSIKAIISSSAATCRGIDLSVRAVDDDAAMGGVHVATFAFKNQSATACTLMGYPVFRLLNRAGKLMRQGRAINSQQLPGDEEKMPPQLITIQPGKEAGFRVYYNSGGAGHMGKPCPTSRRVWISAPGSSRSFVLNEQIQSCSTVKVSAIRRGAIE